MDSGAGAYAHVNYGSIATPPLESAAVPDLAQMRDDQNVVSSPFPAWTFTYGDGTTSSQPLAPVADLGRGSTIARTSVASKTGAG
jgi:hypothetical protein